MMAFGTWNEAFWNHRPTRSNAAQIMARWPDVVEEFGDLSQACSSMAENVESHREQRYYAWIASVLRPFLGRRTGAGCGTWPVVGTPL